MKHKTKKVLKVIGIILLCGVLVSFGLSLFGGGNVSNPFKKEINDKNLLKIEHHIDNKKEGKIDAGTKITWKDDGTFVLSGKSDDKDLSNKDKIEFGFAEISLLPAGRYTLSANNKDASGDTFGLFVRYGDKVVYTEKDGEASFEVDTASTVQVGWYVVDEHLIIREKVEPTIVSGTTAIKYFK